MTTVDSSETSAPLNIELNPDWAASLSYDFLDHPDEHRPIFVGRQHLLDPLVADIMHPEKTGAYLISGYRGSGKTTLLIEALRRAQQAAGKSGSARKQFVVVLNVSEVSASLESSTDRSSEPITIDPRRLLIALLRSLTNRIRSYESNPGNRTLSQQLKTRISETYDKAIASTYTQASAARREQEENRSSRSALEISATTPYKLGGTLAALAALAIEAVTWSNLRLGLAHVLAGLAAATAAWSWTKSWTVSKSLRETRSTETTLRFDNSLQQLENDLKDILQLLYKESMRTIVVLEELDKIDDAGGAQLDRVIRYFKNLFTQAPALFFFLADKAYFDLVESRIRKARSRRYYALEHTFFTHRLYVGRPNLQDSLDYLRQATADDVYKTRIADVYSGRKVSATPDGERFDRFVRTLVFRSANHLFDLKNELRRYVRNVGGSEKVALSVDDQSFPEEEAALSVFQDLVESKIRAYAFGRERTYANEALQDYLYGVFQEIGSTRPQFVMSFYPQPSHEVETAPREGATPQTTRVDSSLEWDEIQRITDAVDSLITDLARGGAFESIERTIFLWRRNPARTFRLERQLEKHEVELLSEVRRLIGELEQVESSIAIGQLVPEAKALLYELRDKERTLQLPETSIPLEQANAEKESFQSRFLHHVADLYRIHLEQVKHRYHLDFEQVQYGPGAEGIYRLRVQHQPPPVQSTDDPGEREVLVILGALQSFGMVPMPASPSLKRASIVQVVRNPQDSIQGTAAHAWASLHQPVPPATDVRGSIVGPEPVTVSLDIIGLDEGLSTRSNPDWSTWGQLLGDTILFRVFWSGRWKPLSVENRQVQVARLDKDESEREATRSTLVEAAAAWAQAGHGQQEDGRLSRLLWIATPPSGESDETRTRHRPESIEELQKWERELWTVFGQAQFVDVAPIHPSELSRPDGMVGSIPQVVTPPDVGPAITERLVQRGRLVCLSAADGMEDGRLAREIRQIVGAQGRAVYVGERLPDEFRRLGVTRVELP